MVSTLAALGAIRSGRTFAAPSRALSREEVRLVDEKAISMGLPGMVLMENAALGLTDVVCDELASCSAAPDAVVGIVVGKGNNGGDGFVLARHLVLRGYRPRVAYCGSRAAAKRETDAGINLSILENFDMCPIIEVKDGVELRSLLCEQWADAALLVDAIYGTGLSAQLRPEGAALIDALNTAPQPIVACDLPSGLDCDSGVPLGTAVKAVRTVTFVGRKLGFDQPGAEEYTGVVSVVPIGCPEACWAHVK